MNSTSSVLPKFEKQSTNKGRYILLLSSRIAQAILNIRSITMKLGESFSILIFFNLVQLKITPSNSLKLHFPGILKHWMQNADDGRS